MSPSSCTVINSTSLKFKGSSRKKGTSASTLVNSDSAPHTLLQFSIKTVNTVSMKRWDWSKSHQGLQHVLRAFSVLESTNFSEIKECSTSTLVVPKIFSKTRLILSSSASPGVKREKHQPSASIQYTKLKQFQDTTLSKITDFPLTFWVKRF